MKPGYELPPTGAGKGDFFFSVPDAQALADQAYLHGSGNSLDHYYAMCDQWVDNNVRLRAGSPDPLRYTPTAYPPIPKREIISWEPKSQQPESRFEQDPAILPPALPPYVVPDPTQSGGFHTTLPQAQADETARFNMLVRMLMDIKAMLQGAK
jgi:hypothetical protein